MTGRRRHVSRDSQSSRVGPFEQVDDACISPEPHLRHRGFDFDGGEIFVAITHHHITPSENSLYCSSTTSAIVQLTCGWFRSELRHLNLTRFPAATNSQSKRQLDPFRIRFVDVKIQDPKSDPQYYNERPKI
jgi:hypothetical protein